MHHLATIPDNQWSNGYPILWTYMYIQCVCVTNTVTLNWGLLNRMWNFPFIMVSTDIWNKDTLITRIIRSLIPMDPFVTPDNTQDTSLICMSQHAGKLKFKLHSCMIYNLLGTSKLHFIWCNNRFVELLQKVSNQKAYDMVSVWYHKSSELKSFYCHTLKQLPLIYKAVSLYQLLVKWDYLIINKAAFRTSHKNIYVHFHKISQFSNIKFAHNDYIILWNWKGIITAQTLHTNLNTFFPAVERSDFSRSIISLYPTINEVVCHNFQIVSHLLLRFQQVSRLF